VAEVPQQLLPGLAAVEADFLEMELDLETRLVVLDTHSQMERRAVAPEQAGRPKVVLEAEEVFPSVAAVAADIAAVPEAMVVEILIPAAVEEVL
jgi:hypothetical protein